MDVQLSFCNGSKTKEKVELDVTIIQTGSDITLVLLDELEDQYFEGRTSNFSIGVESNDDSQVTVLYGEVKKNANQIVGNIVFIDKHECPEANTGEAKFRLVRTSE